MPAVSLINILSRLDAVMTDLCHVGSQFDVSNFMSIQRDVNESPIRSEEYVSILRKYDAILEYCYSTTKIRTLWPPEICAKVFTALAKYVQMKRVEYERDIGMLIEVQSELQNVVSLFPEDASLGLAADTLGNILEAAISHLE